MPCRAVCLLLASMAMAAPATGQVVTGRVIQAGTDNGLADVHVQLLFIDGRQAASAVTDTAGRFRIHAPRIGAFTVTAERVGLTTVTTQELRLNVSESVDVTLRMDVTAVPLEPLTVMARDPLDLGLLAGYFERIERQQRLGFGHIITRDRIQERQALDVADLLREIPGVSVVQGPTRMPAILFRGPGGECIPMVYINGLLQNRGAAAGSMAVVDDTVRPHELEGVEVYRGVSEMPAEFYDDTRCGVILLWTRRDAEGGRPANRRLLLGALAGLAAFALIFMR